MNEKIDVMAVMDKAIAKLGVNWPNTEADMVAARAAIAELIEADKEYDDSLKAFSAGPRPDLTATSMDEWAEEWVNVARRADLHDRLQSTKARRASALARVGGGK